MKRQLATIGAVALSATLLAASPASAMRACPTEDSTGPCHWSAKSQGNHKGHDLTNYRHHRTVAGEPALTGKQVRRVERLVHRLHYCDWPTEVTDCKNKLGHHSSNASFHADDHIYYVDMHRSKLIYVEVYN